MLKVRGKAGLKMVKSQAMLLATVCLGVAGLIGCGGTAAAAGGSPGAPPPPGPAITVSVTAAPPSLGVGQSSTLTAAVTNDSKNAGVTWSLGSGDAGTLTSENAVSATYSPGNFTQGGSASITATSVTDSTKSASVTIPYGTSITVTLSATPGSLGPDQSASITATVTNDAQNAGVTWSLSSGAAGALTRVDGLHASYAPGNFTQAGTATITATSVTDITKSASVAIPYSPLPIAVSATANPASLGANQTSTLTATVSNDPNNAGVTWSLATGAPGTLTTVDALHATYAPGAVTVTGTAAITATSNTDSTKHAVVSVAYGATAPTVEIGTPGTGTVGPLQTSLLSASTLDPSGVTWSASAGTVTPLNNCTGGECTAIYTAPGDIASSGTATVTAASVSNPSATATTTINLTAATFWEDLVAFENGFQLGVAKPYKDLERGTGTGIYQPDRMIFHEIALGRNGQPINTEVWRLDNDGASATPDGSGASAPNFMISGVLNRTPWNANGTYFNLQANPCVIEVFCSDRTTGQGADIHNYLYDAAGDLQQLIVPAVPSSTDPASQITQPLAMVSGEYLPWDKLNPNLFYVTNGNTGFQDGQTHNALYSVDISNQFTVKKIVDLPLTNPGCATAANPCPSSIGKGIQSYLSEDDVVMVDDGNPPIVTAPAPPAYVPYIYMVDVNPNRPTTQNTIVDQFPINFSASLPNGLPLPVCPPNLDNGCTPPHSPSEEYHFHDIFFQRDAADHFIFNYGPKGSGGEGFFWVAPENGQASLVTSFFPDANTPYFSHPAMNSDGSLVAYSGYDSVLDSNSNLGFGNWVWSLSANLGLGGVVGNMGSQGTGHQGWDGYDPNYVVFDAFTGTPDASGNQPWSQMTDSPSDPDGTHARVLVDMTRNEQAVANGTEISLLDGPSQSPDGTKMMFVLPETFQVIANQTTQFSAYIAVDHRPFPPTLAVTATGAGGVALSWTPYPYHLEIAGYHVYRQTGCSGAWAEVTNANNTAAAAFGSINATGFTDTSAQAGATYCYAVTAQEYSGLESNQLSNIMQVPVGGSATQTAAAGTTGWDTTAPAPPSGLAVTQLGPSEWKLTWQASPAPNLRYYNIYYSGGGVPNVSDPVTAQHYLIDSPAATETSYIYWEANPNDVPVFGIVAVDRQDQVSPLACIATANPTAACGGQ